MAGQQSSQVAAEAQQLHVGDLVIQLDPEKRQIIFGVLEAKNVNPIIFDLNNGLIYNAAFPQEQIPVDTSPVPA
jgi:hypothetical protein